MKKSSTGGGRKRGRERCKKNKPFIIAILSRKYCCHGCTEIIHRIITGIINIAMGLETIITEKKLEKN